MVAVISGNGLGLGNTSLTQLGGAQGGSPSLGQAGNAGYVNAATGNLILQSADEGLLFDGLPLSVLRTYNSQGALNGQADWRYGFSRSIGGLTGTLNTAGSTITRTGDDGSMVVYTYDTDRGLYVSSGQSGAQDTLSWDATSSTWTYTDAADQLQETYAASGELQTLTNTATGASYSFSYSNGELSQIVAGDGDTLLFDYNTAGQLIDLRVQEIPPGQSVAVTRQAVSYGYDAQGRLTSVTTNLASDTNAGGSSYTTTYTYDGTSDRVASVTQSDGTTVSYGYTQDAQGAWQVTSVTTGSGTDAQTVTMSYSATGMSEFNAVGQRTNFLITSSGLLDMVFIASSGGQPIENLYTYDANGNVLTVISNGRQTTYTYDDQGNLASVTDLDGDVVTYSYDANDQLISRTVYGTPQQSLPGYYGYAPASDPRTNYNVYDGQGRLAYTIDALGNVVAYSYVQQGGISLLSSRQQLTGVSYDLEGASPASPPTLSQLDAWMVSSPVQASLSHAVRTDYSYDPRGQLSEQIQWSHLDTNGQGTLATDTGGVVTLFTYDAQGRLLQTGTLRGSDRDTSQVTSYSYDGLGRLLSSTDALGHVTSYTYTGGGQQIAVTLANGLTTVQVRNSAGLLVSSTTSGNDTPVRETDYLYNAAGQQVAMIDPDGGVSYTFYDGFGRVSGTVDPTGAMTGYVYDLGQLVTQTTQYATRVDTSGWIDNGELTASLPTVLPVPTASANDLVTRTIYDGEGRVAATIAPDNTVTAYQYDGAGNLVASRQYALPASSDAIDQIWNSTGGNPSVIQYAIPTSPDDRVTLSIYDADNRPVASIDSAGTVRTVSYDNLGNVIATSTYATTLNADQFAQLEASCNMATLRTLLGSTSQTIYDAQNLPVATIGADGKVTVNSYDAAGKLLATQAFATALTSAQLIQLGAAPTLAALLADIAPSAGDQTTLTIYDALEHPLATIAPDGSVTTTVYDANGNATAYTVYATALTAADFASLGLTPTFAQLQAVLHAGAGDQATLTIYDANDRPIASVDPAGQVTVTAYDAAGRVTSSRVYATALDATQITDLGTTPTWAQLQADLTDSGTDQITLTVYDASGNIVGTVDAEGNVVITRYDALGNVSGSTAYAQPLSEAVVAALGTAPTLEQLQAAIIADSGDQVSITIHDDGDGLVATVGADGSVKLDAYDTSGHLLASSQLAQNLSAMQLAVLGATPDWSTLQDFLSQDEGALDALTVTDAQGRPIITVDVDGQVTTTSYDAAGRITSTITYANDLTASQAATLAADPSMQTLQGLISASDSDQASVTVYDDAGHVVATVTSGETATTMHYDAAGRVTSSVSYYYAPTATQIESLGSAPTLEVLQQFLTPSDYDQASATIYDANGHVLAQVGANQTVVNTYDDQGNLVSSVNYGNYLSPLEIEALGSAPTMAQLQHMYDAMPSTYVFTIYDAQGRKIASHDAGGTFSLFSYNQDGSYVQTESDASLSFDQLTALAGAADQASVLQQLLPTITSDIDVLVFFDAQNNQVARVVLDDYYTDAQMQATLYDGNGRVIESTTYEQSLSGQQQASLLADPTLDNLQSIMQDAPIDQQTITIYDDQGGHQATVQVYPQGYAIVSATTFDAHGNPIVQTQYGNTLDDDALNTLRADPTYATLQSLITPVSWDDTTLNFYDASQNKVASVDRYGAVTTYSYNAAGQVISQTIYDNSLSSEELSAQQTSPDLVSLQGELTPSAYDQSTLTFYDAEGRVTATVTPVWQYNDDTSSYEYGGQVTTITYSADGGVVTTRQYANTITAAQLSQLNGTEDVSALQADLTPDNDNDTVTFVLYDGQGRQVASFSRPGDYYDSSENQYIYGSQVTLTTYADNGSEHLVRTVTYNRPLTPEQIIALGDAPTLAQIQAVLTPESGDIGHLEIDDANGNPLVVIQSINGQYEFSANTYNAFGELLGTRAVYISSTQFSSVATTATSADLVEQFIDPEGIGQSSGADSDVLVLDSQGRVIADIAPSEVYDPVLGQYVQGGLVTTYQYDTFGNVIKEHIYANRLVPEQIQSLGSPPSWATLQSVLQPSDSDLIALHVYDEDNRLIASVGDQQWGEVALYNYDSNGNQTEIIQYSQSLSEDQVASLGDTPTLDQIKSLVTPSSQDLIDISVYDADGNVAASIDEYGNVRRYQYDADGNQIGGIEYSRQLSLAQVRALGGAPSLAQLMAIVKPSSTDDVDLNFYDAQGNLVGSVEDGVVYTTLFGANGYDVQDRSYSSPLTPAQVTALIDSPTLATLMSLVTPSDNDVVDAKLYDDNGNLLGQLDTDGQITLNTRDAAGNLLTTTVYPQALDAREISALGYPVTLAALQSAVASLSGSTTHNLYDADGRLAAVVDPSGTVILYRYNDTLHTVVQQTYTDALSSDQFTALGDTPSLAMLELDLGVANGASLSQTLYDGQGHVIATISATGDVTTTTYDAAGHVTSTTQYATPLSSGHGYIATIEQLLQQVVPSSQDVTNRTIYDASGRIAATIDPTGLVKINSYDSHGNLVAVTGYTQALTQTQLAQLGDAPTLGQVEALVDPTARTIYNAANQPVVSIDQDGRASYAFYDDAGRLSLSVDVGGDATGYVYDANGNATQVTQYATPIDTSGWLVDGTLSTAYPETAPHPTLASTDRVTTNIYDTVGELVATIDPAGNVTTLHYDAVGDLLEQTSYATALTAQQRTSLGSTPSLNDLLGVVAGTSEDRVTREIYDNRGNVVASIDAAGYVVTTTYDGDNRPVVTSAYATALSAQQMADLNDTSTLADLQAMVTVSAQDERTRLYYDASGRTSAQIDAAGYLTVYSYDIDTDTTTSTRYATALAVGQVSSLDGNEGVDDLVADLGDNLDCEQSSITYNAFGQVASRTDIDGTVTSYSYDGAGRVLSTTVTPIDGQGDPRTTSNTYDSQGNLITVTDANGGVTTYQYNAAGQRIKATDADGNSTWYYYDSAARLAYVVEGEPGDPEDLNLYGNVTAYAYDAFGDTVQTTTYSGQLTLTTSLGGTAGTVNPDLATAQSVAAAVATFGAATVTSASYTADGQIATLTDADGYSTQNSYDAFGDLVQAQVQLGQAGQALSAGNSTTTQYSYDKRGLRIGEIDGVGNAVQRTTAASYDAFGNRVGTIDGNGDGTSYSYDALNRQTGTAQTVQGSTRESQVTYDAFNRVLSRTDALGHSTTYSYDVANHSMVVTSPDGVVMTTIEDAFGDIVSTSDGAGNATSYTYDGDGSRLTTTDALGDTSSAVYDAVGNAIQTTDATGHVVTYTYDAEGNVITRVVDPSGLNEQTNYYYDGQGNLTEVDDPLSTVTLYGYDGDGNLVLQVDDAGAAGQTINATTRYTYDGAGNVLTVTKGDGTPQASTTQYIYDALGQLSQQIVDPGDLALTTSYAYDGAGNNVAITDPNGNTVYVIYNEAGEAVYTMTPVGAQGSGQAAITHDVYDADGQLIATTTYGTAVSTASLGGLAGQAPAANLQAVAQLVASVSGGADPTSYAVYNGDGQQVFQIDPRGFVTETRYNALGQVAQTLAYANAITIDAGLAQALASGGDVSTSVQAALAAANDNDASARVNCLYYDADGRVAYSATPTLVNGQPAVVVIGTTYDEAGRVIATSVYGEPLSLADIGNGSTTDSVAAALADVNDASTTRVTQYAFDNAGNQVLQIDPNGVVSYQIYDNDNRLVGAIDGNGAAVAYERDDLGRVVRQTSYFDSFIDELSGVPVDATQFAQWTLDLSDQWNDRVIATTYDALGRVDTVTHYNMIGGGGEAEFVADMPGDDGNDGFYNSGDTVTYTYDAASRLVSSVDDDLSYSENSREIDYYYDGNGNVVGKQDPSGYVTTYVYDAANQLVQTTAYATVGAGEGLSAIVPASSPADQITRQFYDVLGNCIGILDADGYFTQYSFDLDGNQVSSLRYTTLVPASDQGSLVSIQAFLSGTAGEQTSNAYDAYGELVSTTDPFGTTTVYAYDATGNVLQTTVAGGTTDARSTSATYDAFGNVSSATDGMGQVTTYVYDLAGNRTSMTDVLGNTTWYVYDADNRVVYTISGETDGSGQQNGLGEVSRNEYDMFGDVVDVANFATLATLPEGFAPDSYTMQGIVDAIQEQGGNDYDQFIDYSYDMEGNVVEQNDGNGNVTSYIYDGFNQLTELDERYGGLQTVYSYDDDGNLTSKADYNSPYSSCGSGGEAVLREQDWTYDAFGRVTTYVDGNGATTSYTYDNLNQQTSQSLTVQGAVRETQTSYDGYGRVISTTDALGLATTYAYDDAARSLTVTAPGGYVTTTLLNREGQQISVTDPEGHTTTYQYDADGRLSQTVQADGGVATVQYDADGNAIRTVDAAGHAIAYTYDAAGRVLTQTVDPDGLALVTTYQYDGRGLEVQVVDPTGAVTTYAHDGNGNVTYSISQIGTGDNVYTVTTESDYDLHNKLRESYTYSSDPNDNDEYDDYYNYNALGEMISSQTATGQSGQEYYTYDADGNVTSKTDGNGAITYYAYNEADELVYTITPMGGSGGEPGQEGYVSPSGVVTQNSYNADGQLVGTRQYASVIGSGDMATYVFSGQNWGSIPLVPSIADINNLVQTGSNDRVRYSVYGSDGQLQYSIDATGTVTEYRYNTAGQLWQTLVHGRSIDVSSTLSNALLAGTASAADIQSALSAAGDTSVTPRSTYTYYDAMGNVRYTVATATVNGQSGGIVTAYGYDADGNAITETQYGRLIPLSQLGTTSTAASLDAFLAGATDTHVTHNVYDAAGRLVYTVNPAGFVAELQYDGDGRTTWTLQYANAIGTPASWDQADVAAAVAAANTDPSTVHGTGNVYDLAGNLIETLDKLSDTPVATYTYNAVGEKTSYTNRDGQTWTYQYDREGNLTVEVGPSVAVMGYDGNGAVQQSIETDYSYDGDGHLISQIDNANTSASRETDFVYDSSGKLLQTILPPSGSLSPGQGLSDADATASIDITYDVFGDAVVSKDANGNYAYDIYDADGRLSYAIDSNGYVTGYTYDAYGEQTGVTRYANAVDVDVLSGSGWQEGQPISATQLQSLLQTSSSDRTLTTTYDLQGNKTSVTQPAVTYTLSDGSTATGSPQITYTYDAYGNVTSQSVLEQGVPGQANAVWATTYNYYNALGQPVMTVDPMGYVTTSTYDAFGNVTSTTEWATAIATSGLTAGGAMPANPPAGQAATTGLDRVTQYTYDVDGRKISESVQRTYIDDQGQTVAGFVTTTYGYDGENRITTITTDGRTTTTVYDALGRVISVTGPAEPVLVDNWQQLLEANPTWDLTNSALYTTGSQVVTYAYDAFGNKLMQSIGSTASSSVSNTFYMYDQRGNLVASVNAGNQATFDWNDPNIESNPGLTRYTYDDNGNLLSSISILQGNDGSSVYVVTSNTYDADGRLLSTVTQRVGAALPDKSVTTVYDGFGDVVATGNGVAVSSTQAYDNAGNLVSATDPKTGVQHTYGYNLAGQRVSDTWANTATTYTLDLDGRTVAERGPSTTSATGQSPAQVTATYDRWGNVLTSTDALGGVTTYTYNERNQLVTQAGPTVTVVGANGAATTATPTKTIGYDDSGNAVIVTDENGNVTRTRYNATGQIVAVTDGANGTSYTAYDALGNEAGDQDGIGHIVFKDYDSLGHVIIQGDFVLAADSQSRQVVWQQAYVVDQSGNRLISYDGIGSAYLQADDTTDAALHANYYGYDSQGRVLWSQDAAQRAASQSNNHGATQSIDAQPTNPSFEDGDVGWTLADGWSIPEGYGYTGNWAARLDNVGAAGSQTPGSTIVNQNRVPVVPGQSISATAQIQQGASDVGHTGAAVQILWFDAQGNLISTSTGNYVIDGAHGDWHPSSVTGTAPANAAYACVAINGWNISSDPLYADDVSWSYVPSPTVMQDPNAPIVVSLPSGTFTQQPANPDFEKGNVGWVLGGSWSIFQGYGYGGDPAQNTSARLDYTGPSSLNQTSVTNIDRVPVTPGQTIHASAMVQQGASDVGQTGAYVQIHWYDANGNLISTSNGNIVDDGRHGAWHNSDVIATAPPGAAYASIGFSGWNTTTDDPLWVDGLRWDYQYLPSIPTGVIQTTYNYDLDGNLIREVDADNNTETWTYDSYGRVLNHTDLSGANYTYTYDATTGLLSGESDNWSAAGQGQLPPTYVTGPLTTPNSSTRTYNAAGQLTSITYADGSSTTYAYDLNGNITREEDITHDGGNQLVDAVTVTAYDSHNRISEVKETNAVTGTQTLDETYSYDAAGNRREVHAVSGSTTTDAWYTYDGDNRVQISDGALSNGQIVITSDSNSYQLVYDGDGNATTRFTRDAQGNLLSQASRYDLRSELVAADYAINVTTGGQYNGVEEQRTYDADGHVISTVTFYEKGTSLQGRPTRKVDPDSGQFIEEPGASTDVSGFLDTATVDHYDAVGRLLSEQDFGHADDWDGSDGDGNLPSQLPGLDDTTYGSLDLQSAVVYEGANGTPGYDAVGNVVAYQYREGDGRIDQYLVTYYKKDGYLQAETSGTNLTNTPNVQPATDESIYDTRGNLVELDQHVQYAGGGVADNVRMFAYNANGEIIQRRDGTETNGNFDQGSNSSHENQHYVFVNGQQVAHYDDGGTLDVLDQVTAFSNTQGGTSDYVVQTGDTLKSIAQAMYGNASLWYVIAQANALSSDDQLAVGQDLTIPQVTTHENDATTFKPYNPSDTIGSTTPTLPTIAPPPPPPQASGGCSAAEIIVIVVTIVVTIVTYGSTSEALYAELGTTAAEASTGEAIAVGAVAGAAAGAAGNAAGQLVGDAEGIHSGFDWGSIGQSALAGGITGGVTAGLGQTDAFSTGEFDSAGNPILNGWGDLVQGASNYAANVAAAKLTGQPTHFSWAGVIASSVSNLAAAEIGQSQVGSSLGQTSGAGYLQQVAASAVGDVVNREVSVLLGDQRVPSWTQVAEDIIGHVIADAITPPLENALGIGSDARNKQLGEKANALISNESDELNTVIAGQTDAAIRTNAQMAQLSSSLSQSINNYIDSQADASIDNWLASDESALVSTSADSNDQVLDPKNAPNPAYREMLEQFSKSNGYDQRFPLPDGDGNRQLQDWAASVYLYQRMLQEAQVVDQNQFGASTDFNNESLANAHQMYPDANLDYVTRPHGPDSYYADFYSPSSDSSTEQTREPVDIDLRTSNFSGAASGVEDVSANSASVSAPLPAIPLSSSASDLSINGLDTLAYNPSPLSLAPAHIEVLRSDALQVSFDGASAPANLVTVPAYTQPAQAGVGTAPTITSNDTETSALGKVAQRFTGALSGINHSITNVQNQVADAAVQLGAWADKQHNLVGDVAKIVGGIGYVISAPVDWKAADAQFASWKGTVQGGLATFGGWADRKGGVLGKTGYYVAGGLSVADEILQPGSVAEAGLIVASPAIGKVVGAGITVLNKIPLLGKSVGSLSGIWAGASASASTLVRRTVTEGVAAADSAAGRITVKIQYKPGLDVREFARKVNRLQQLAQEGRLTSNIPHNVSAAERNAVTRQYRAAVERRINSLYANNPQARNNALQRLRASDIDHIQDLQLGGGNVRSNLKALDSLVNQELGRQVSRQLPRGVRIPVTQFEVYGL